MIPQRQSLIGRKLAFTLIELLIVVAIIAILAAIAVPNFLEAQVRAKVARVKSDMRTMRTAIEAYSVDFNRSPRHSWGGVIPGFHPAYNGTVQGDKFLEGIMYGTLTWQITTPVAYLTTFDFRDPFVANRIGSVEGDFLLYTYQAAKWHEALKASGATNGPGARASVQNAIETRKDRRDFGEYFLLSIGPKGYDQLYAFPVTPGANIDYFYMQYDPTNGTTSAGTIYVSQRNTDIVQRRTDGL